MKLNQGEHFPSLEMLTTLLPQKRKELRGLGEKPKIEVLEPGATGGGGAGEEGGVASKEEEEEEFDWEVEQDFSREAEKVLADALKCAVCDC